MDKLLERFCRYVKVETTAVEDIKDYPTSPGQLELGRMLAAELRDLGLRDTNQDENGIVTATVPGNMEGAPTIAFLAHMDTSPEASGKSVKPIIHENYDGKDIQLTGDPTKVIKVDETEELGPLKGKTIITTDGTTLLGGDDKAGIAVIMTAVDHLMTQREIQHGPVRVVFTCDEEVGRGTEKLEVEKIGAICAYTLDGEDEGGIENETFSADLATVTLKGANIHPGFAKGKMVNAIRLAGAFLSRMPWQSLAPEATEGREGFLHPYVLEGGVSEARIKILLRSFDSSDLPDEAELLRKVAATIVAEHPRAEIEVDVQKQYRNMLEYLSKEPRAVDLASKAVRNVGFEPAFESIRGGTDGSRLSEMGLPTPNLSVGMHNFHSPLEFACLEQMQSAVKVVTELIQLWGKER